VADLEQDGGDRRRGHQQDDDEAADQEPLAGSDDLGEGLERDRSS
jgi:hypothetical protein